MSVQIFPITSTSSSSVNSYGYTVADAKTSYKIIQNFSPAVYSITSPISVVATVTFFDGNGNLYETQTSSGTVSFNLGTSATGAYITTDSGTNVVVTITLSSLPLTGTNLSGTLDTITSTSTYNQTGTFLVVAIGGGGGGGGGGGTTYGGGGGGASVGVAKFVKTNTATSITIGSAGNGGTGSNNQTGDGNAGGTTNFGNLVTSNGGGAGQRGWNSSAYPGSFGGGRGSRGDGNNSAANATAVPVYSATVINGTNGGGGGGAGFGVGTGAGSGIGTGGNGNGTTATGYGAGGGGGPGSGNVNAGAGSPGVVYVLRGF